MNSNVACCENSRWGACREFVTGYSDRLCANESFGDSEATALVHALIQ